MKKPRGSGINGKAGRRQVPVYAELSWRGSGTRPNFAPKNEGTECLSWGSLSYQLSGQILEDFNQVSIWSITEFAFWLG